MQYLKDIHIVKLQNAQKISKRLMINNVFMKLKQNQDAHYFTLELMMKLALR